MTRSSARISEPTEELFIALSFVADAELHALAAKAIGERMAPADIRKAIRAWRPGYTPRVTRRSGLVPYEVHGSRA